MIKKALIVCTGIGFFIGLGFFLYPHINSWLINSGVNREIENFNKEKEKHVQQGNDILFETMNDYNLALYENGQNGISDAWTFEQKDFVLNGYDLKNEAIATIEIPKMNIQMPIYLGASKENMAKGIAVLANTSLPIGGINTNCVLAGHRGYRGAPFFRDIENLQIGDIVIINNFWQELHYTVSAIEVILPDQSEKVLIQKGQDMITLITCHPYRKNYQRYVVYCTRDENTNKEENNDLLNEKQKNKLPITSSKNTILIERYLPVVGLVFLIIFIFVLFKKKNSKKN